MRMHTHIVRGKIDQDAGPIGRMNESSEVHFFTLFSSLSRKFLIGVSLGLIGVSLGKLLPIV